MAKKKKKNSKKLQCNRIVVYLDSTETVDYDTNCVKEDSFYMADYIWDESGQLCETNYHKVKKNN
ncbi:MAG: hypothetical protein R3Y54_05035 [Eubacteriales bacterium]